MRTIRYDVEEMKIEFPFHYIEATGSGEYDRVNYHRLNLIKKRGKPVAIEEIEVSELRTGKKLECEIRVSPIEAGVLAPGYAILAERYGPGDLQTQAANEFKIALFRFSTKLARVAR